MRLRELLEAIGADALGLMPDNITSIIKGELENYARPATVEVRNQIPAVDEIPLDNPNHWFRIPNLICCFVDMAGSTKLSAAKHDKETAQVYRLFTSTAIKIFDAFDCPYMDIKGDGVFGLFNSDTPHTALAAAVSFKTFVANDFKPAVQQRTGIGIDAHIGIDAKTVLVRRFGFRMSKGRDDRRQNEVWAGKPVNMAAKLGSLSNDSSIIVSDRFHNLLSHPKALKSCGCPSGIQKNLWDEISVRADDRFDFDKAYRLGSSWCQTHGKTFCRDIVQADA